MSSFVLDTDHIDLMVAYALYNIGSAERLTAYIEDADGELRCMTIIEDRDQAGTERIRASDLGKVLLTQNVRSVVHNYQNADTDELIGYSRMIAEYEYRPVQLFRLAEGQRLEADVIQACRCYDYQACETGDLTDTEAGQWSQLIYRKAGNALADRYSQTWEWRRRDAGVK